jgi:flagellar M-ring protein FliF
MNPVFEQIAHIYKAMPLSRKLLMGGVLAGVLAGFALMFFWANKLDFQPLFTNLHPEDASAVVEKLKEQKIPYKLGGNGTVVLVPGEKVYDLRLTMAAAGLPKGSGVGFEIFDKNDFGTTEFVQKLNYQRALQGELARTIKEFREVDDARVMIVMPRESVFVQETKPPSASVLLKLESRISREKVSAIVHLVASAVEGLDPERVTVVDTEGRVMSKGSETAQKAENLPTTQLEYKTAYEQAMAQRIQTMLERIVGAGKAIVRVNADMDFDQVNVNEEIYDPDVQVVRSRQSIDESSNRNSGPAGNASSVNPVTAPAAAAPAQTPAATATGQVTTDTSKRKDDTVNYEINKTLRQTVKPVGSVKQLSVAVVLDGTYSTQTDSQGKTVRKFVARSPQEISQFTTIVQRAMGYNADRNDQVSVESFPFSYMQDLSGPTRFDWVAFSKQYGRSLVNVLLVMLIFVFVVLPMIKTVREIKAAVVTPALAAPQGAARALIGADSRESLPAPGAKTIQERALALAREDMQRTANLIRGWLGETT